MAIFSWNPREKCSKDSTSFGEILDIHQAFVGFSASRPQQEPFTSVVPVSVAHLCVSYTQWNVERCEYFQLENSSKTARNGLQPMFKRLIFEGNHAVSVQVKKDVLCPTRWLEQCSVSILRCKPQFSHCTDSGSIPNTYLTVRWNRLWNFHSHSAAFSFQNSQPLLTSPSSSGTELSSEFKMQL